MRTEITISAFRHSGSDPTAAGGGNREGSECSGRWGTKVERPRTSTGHRKRRGMARRARGWNSGDNVKSSHLLRPINAFPHSTPVSFADTPSPGGGIAHRNYNSRISAIKNQPLCTAGSLSNLSQISKYALMVSHTAAASLRVGISQNTRSSGSVPEKRMTTQPPFAKYTLQPSM